MSCITMAVEATLAKNCVRSIGDYGSDIERIIFSSKQLDERIQVLGRILATDYSDKAPLVLPVLKGSVVFAVDLVKAMQPCPKGLTLDFIKASSYGSGTESSGEVKLSVDIKPGNVKGRHVLLVEDIVDTGRTIVTITKWLEACGAASVTCATLLDKVERRIVDYVPKYVCFQCPNDFVVGYGLDFNEEYRTLPFIGVLKPHCYEGLVEP